MLHNPPPSHRRAHASSNTTYARRSAAVAVAAVAALALAGPVIATAVPNALWNHGPAEHKRSLVEVKFKTPLWVAPSSTVPTVVRLRWDRRLPAGTIVVRADGERIAKSVSAGGVSQSLVKVTLAPLSSGNHQVSAAYRVNGRLMGKSEPTTVVSGGTPPSNSPSSTPSSSPTHSPSSSPTHSPSSSPSSSASTTPSATPTTPSSSPTTPSGSPTTPTPSPTQSPTQTPSGSCTSVPSACGYPDATNTGPAPGTVFTKVPSQVTSGTGWSWNSSYQSVMVSGTGVVLNGLDIAGGVVIDAPNVTVSNSRIASCGGSDDSDAVAIRYKASDPSYRGSNAHVVDNDINGTPAGCTHRARSGVRDVYGEAPNAFVDGNNIYGTGNGITIEHQGVVSNNWVHGLGHLAGDHHSGLSTHGGALQVTFQHNTVLLHGQQFPGGGGLSGAITVYSDFGHAQNTTIVDNFVSGGSYVIYGGNSGNEASTPSTNIKIRGNRFVCGAWDYGPVAAFTPSSTGNEWSGNFCDGTGATVNP